MKLKCPVPRRALSFGLALFLALAGCGYVPRPVEGVPPGPPWEALPLGKWLAEDRAEPQALSFCAPPECRPGLAVAVVRLKGKDAETTDRLMRKPAALAQALRSPKTAVSTVALQEGPSYGFTISLGPQKGGKAPAFGAVLGQRSGEDLMVVLVIGDAADAVEATARRVARAELGQ
ncbi:hypothetical protein [Microvirga terricola]|uniref:Uncharacterized protein n=1 Tax=Microvirga terricola TaxID=2719797 RepID=A0ABX0VEB5_9HYPH|nr:hypothetical protein [Microvirga terricola]NIX78182.1 hypothetical protein [Microvirga terricola]